MALSDFIVLAAILLMASFTMVIAFTIWTAFSTQFNATIGTGGPHSDIITNVNSVFNLFDSMFVYLTIGLMIALVISLYYIDTNPIFFFVTFFVLIISLVLSGQFSNIWEAVVNSPQFNATAGSFVQTNWIMSNLPLVSLAAIVIASIILYAKLGGGGT